jgi:hypothetical protein
VLASTKSTATGQMTRPASATIHLRRRRAPTAAAIAPVAVTAATESIGLVQSGGLALASHQG